MNNRLGRSPATDRQPRRYNWHRCASRRACSGRTCSQPKRVPAAKSELQDTHAGQVEAPSQGVDIGCDHAHVFGDDRQVAQRGRYRVE